MQLRTYPRAGGTIHSARRCRNSLRLSVDRGPGPPLYSPHDGAPPTLRRDGAPAKLLTNGVTRHPSLARMTWASATPSKCGGGEPLWFPGCLTSEPEERETWTARSLRTAFRLRATSCESGRKRLRRYTF